MNTAELNNINTNLYLEAKIYWRPNYNYSSKLFERLMASNNYIMKSSGALEWMEDLKGNKVCSGVGRVYFLRTLADVMR